jgi:hypothetical protein
MAKAIGVGGDVTWIVITKLRHTHSLAVLELQYRSFVEILAEFEECPAILEHFGTCSLISIAINTFDRTINIVGLTVVRAILSYIDPTALEARGQERWYACGNMFEELFHTLYSDSDPIFARPYVEATEANSVADPLIP